MTLMSPLVTGVHQRKGLRRHGGGAPPMGAVVRAATRRVAAMVVGRAAGLQGGVCFTIAITSSIF